VNAVQKLGHASAKTTLDIYAELWPDEEDRTRAAVDAVLGRPTTSPRVPRVAVAATLRDLFATSWGRAVRVTAGETPFSSQMS
jgi:hypothetical protein